MKNTTMASSKKPHAKKKIGSPKAHRVARAAAPARKPSSPPAARRLAAGGSSRRPPRSAKPGAAMAAAVLAQARKQRRAARAAGAKSPVAQPAAPMAGLAPAASVPARYGQAYYGQAHYVITDPAPVPTPGKAKPSLGLASRNDSNLIGFGHSHQMAMQGNVRFPTPEPTDVDFDAALAAYEAKVGEWENHKEMGKMLVAERDALRAAFEVAFTQRANYVVMTSQGDGAWISSAGLPVNVPPTPTGILPPPQNLRLELTQVNGELQVRWNSVTGAKGGYMLEMAEVVDNVAVGWTNIYMGGKRDVLKTGLVSGKTYAFRVAAVGGEGGKSAFSPEVWRMAA